MAEEIRRSVDARLRELRWTKAHLAREAGVDPGTIGAFLAGRRMPNSATLGRIEAALELTPGALGAPGEDPAVAPSADLRGLADGELVAELSYRLEDLRRKLADATRETEGANWVARRLYMKLVPADEEDQELERLFSTWMRLDMGADEGRIAGADVDEYEWTVAAIDARIRRLWSEDPLAVTTQTETTLAARRGSRRSPGKMMSADAEALGEESQDTGGV